MSTTRLSQSWRRRVAWRDGGIVLEATNEAVRDYRGRIMFHCAACRRPLTRDDLFELGMRVPDSGESAEEYCDAELLDRVVHARCVGAATRAG